MSAAHRASRPDRAPRPGWPLRCYRVVRSAVLSVAALIGAVCLVVVGASLVLGMRPVVVVSGSMEPTLPVGAVLLARSVPAADVRVGDIVTVERPRGLGLITHRVVAVSEAGAEAADGARSLELQGDANSTPDAEPYVVTTAAVHVAHVDGVGHLVLGLRTPAGLAVAVAAMAALVALFLLDPAALRRPGPAAAPAGSQAGALAGELAGEPAQEPARTGSST